MKMTSKIIKAPWLPYFPSQYSKIALICWVHGSGTWYWWVLYSKLVSKWMKQGNAFQSAHDLGDFLGIFDKFLSIFLNAFAGAFHNESWNETKLNCCVHLSVHKRREKNIFNLWKWDCLSNKCVGRWLCCLCFLCFVFIKRLPFGLILFSFMRLLGFDLYHNMINLLWRIPAC